MTRPLLFVAVAWLWVSHALAQTTPTPPPPAQAPAPAEPDYPIVRIGMLSYLQYDAELENREGYNAFDVTRAYLNVNAQLSRTVRFRFTPDVKRVTDGSTAGSLVVRVKYAFAELDDVIIQRSWIRFGLHQTPWLDFEESINRYRVQGQMFTERDGMIPGSADFGAGYFAPLGKYLEVQTGVYNGEGFGQTDANKYKSVQGRVTARPFAGRGNANGLRFSGFYNAGSYAANRPRRLGILMGSFEHTHVVSTVQYVAATENPGATATQNLERRGSSVYVEVRQGVSGLAGLVRGDWLDPDEHRADNSQRRVIAGGAYWMVWPRSRVGLVVTNERVHYEPGAAREDENRLLVQTHIEF
jgi:hypothetical protein